MKHTGLGIKFSILIILTMLLMFAAYFFWTSEAERAQAEKEMLEKAQILSLEMDAVWDFFEANQHSFAKDADGNYVLYCVIAAKAVSKFFTNETDYVIHYTNMNTRKPADAPDEFEVQALTSFYEDPSTIEYYRTTTNVQGNQTFRYVRPLYITESCLECHGDPKGELDPYGFPKEGQKIGDIAGAISIEMPLDLYLQGINEKTFQGVAFSVFLIIAGFSIVMIGIFVLVTRPLKAFGSKAEQIEQGDLDVDFKEIGNSDEISELAARFDSMTTNLKSLYAGLESQVDERTIELTKANEILTSQRAQLEETNNLLMESNQFKSDFLAIMSHELRTPLTSIIAFAEMWENSHSSVDEGELAAIHQIRSNGHILLNMVNNILEMARADVGKLELNCEPVDLVELTGLTERTLHFLAEQRSIEFTTCVDTGVPIIYADWEKLRRIVENLATNAIKFTQKGGKVHVHIGKTADEEAILISVSDTGIGIQEQNINHIFDKFTQSDKSSMRRYRGSGLGLAVVKELTELHGGSVVINSEYKKGTTVEVRIPVGGENWRELS